MGGVDVSAGASMPGTEAAELELSPSARWVFGGKDSVVDFDTRLEASCRRAVERRGWHCSWGGGRGGGWGGGQ